MKNILEIPTVRLQIERMTREIVVALQDWNGDIQNIINDEVLKQIEAYDFEAEVKRVTDKAITEAVGVGVGELLGYQLRDEIRQMVREKIKSKLDKQSD